MSYFEFPHTRSYDGDLGYIIKRLDELTAKYGEFMEYNQIKFADPVEWNINTVYPAWNIVFADNGYYIAVKPVPAGIMYNNTDYWQIITPFTVDDALNTESLNPIANRPVANRFNQVSSSISNVVSSLQNEGRQREEADAALQTQISANLEQINANIQAINAEETARITEDNNINQELDTVSARVDSIAQAITPGTTSADAELIDIRTGYNGVVYANAGTAVRTQVENLHTQIDHIEPAIIPMIKNANNIIFNKEFSDTFGYGTSTLSKPYGDYVPISSLDTDYTFKFECDYESAATYYSIKLMLGRFDASKNMIGNLVQLGSATPTNKHVSYSGTATIDTSGVSYIRLYLQFSSHNQSYSETINVKTMFLAFGFLEIDDIYTWTRYLKTFTNINPSNISDKLPSGKLSDLPVNSISYASADCVITDKPEGVGAFVIINITGYNSLLYAKYQQLYDITSAHLFYRYSANGSAYTPWYKVATTNDLQSDTFIDQLEDNYVKTVVNKPISLGSGDGLFIFGDSIATNTHGGFTWGSLIATRLGCTEHNYAVGQARFSTVTNNNILHQVQSVSRWNDAKVVIVAAGTNEMLDGSVDPTTLRGNVKDVIDEIRDNAPDAEIVFITPIKRTTLAANKIIDIATLICNEALLNKCSVISGGDIPIVLTSDSDDWKIAMDDNDGLHPDADGKWVYAAAVLNALF